MIRVVFGRLLSGADSSGRLRSTVLAVQCGGVVYRPRIERTRHDALEMRNRAGVVQMLYRQINSCRRGAYVGMVRCVPSRRNAGLRGETRIVFLRRTHVCTRGIAGLMFSAAVGVRSHKATPVRLDKTTLLHCSPVSRSRKHRVSAGGYCLDDWDWP